MTDEPRYTLAEARVELARQECGRQGHNLEILLSDGTSPRSVWCRRCNYSWVVAVPKGEEVSAEPSSRATSL